MKKLFLTTALIIAAATSAQAAVNDNAAPSLGDRLKDGWDNNTTRSSFMAPVKHEPAFPGAVNGNAAPMEQNQGAENAPMMHHHHHTAAQKAAWDKKTPEQKAQVKADHKAEHKAKWDSMTPEQKAKAKADRKAKWDAMTPEQKAAWKAKHQAAKKAAEPVAKTTTSTPAAAQ